MAVHMRNGIQYGGIPNGTVKGTTPSTVPTTVKQLNQIGTVGDIAPVTIPSAVKFSNGNTLETAIGSVATIETSPAVATHAVGDYVFYNGQMYKVIAAIAVGETLTVDTNIEATSVGEELTTLNNDLSSFTTRELTLPYTIAAGGSYNVNLKTRIDAILPTGYVCLGVVGFATNNPNVFPLNARYANSDYSLQLKNTSGSSVSTNVIIQYLCAKI